MGTYDDQRRISTTLYVGGSSLDPNALSRVLGIEPTSVWRAGLPGVKDNPQFDQVIWRLKILKQPCGSLNDAVLAIHKMLSERLDEFVSFLTNNKCSVQVRCILFGDETKIVYQVEADMVRFLSLLGSSLSISIDPSSSEDEENVPGSISE